MSLRNKSQVGVFCSFFSPLSLWLDNDLGPQASSKSTHHVMPSVYVEVPATGPPTQTLVQRPWRGCHWKGGFEVCVRQHIRLHRGAPRSLSPWGPGEAGNSWWSSWGADCGPWRRSRSVPGWCGAATGRLGSGVTLGSFQTGLSCFRCWSQQAADPDIFAECFGKTSD